MRHRSEVAVILAVAGFALVGVVAATLMQVQHDDYLYPPTVDIEVQPVQAVNPVAADPADAGAWFRSFRMHCNPVEVDARLRYQPAPATEAGDMQKAACYALAGKIESARAVIDGLPQDRQYHAAGVVFNAGHPAADAGDEIAAGPLMELVVEYWSNHYMALYHAGAAAFERGEQGRAEGYLRRFLVEYSVEDGWRSSANRMLAEIDASS